MSRLRKLLPALALLLLLVPSGAGAAIVTRSNPDRGTLSVALTPAGTRLYGWQTLHYKLHTCEPGVPNVEGCRFTLTGRINPRWIGCPQQEAVTAGGYTSTFYSAPNADGSMAISGGRGVVAYPSSFTNNSAYPTLYACWYIHITGHTHTLLTATTIITPSHAVTE
ncbi:MAG TPA: hypothetical protein VMH33_05890 [Solirubrobacterales bacterium]|nr:hypothetical protein [Solirubrobacterales bacterium]